MSSQDDTVTDFQTITSVTTATLISDILSYHQSLANILFEIPPLDSAHKQQIRETSKETLIQLRHRIAPLLQTLAQAVSAGEF